MRLLRRIPTSNRGAITDHRHRAPELAQVRGVEGLVQLNPTSRRVSGLAQTVEGLAHSGHPGLNRRGTSRPVRVVADPAVVSKNESLQQHRRGGVDELRF